jgi:hypothetical protein
MTCVFDFLPIAGAISETFSIPTLAQAISNVLAAAELFHHG